MGSSINTRIPIVEIITMPEATQEQLTMLDALSNMVKGTSSSFTQTQTSTATGAKPSVSPEDKANRVRANKASQNLKDAAHFFNKSVKADYKTRDQWKLQVEQNGKFLNDAVAAVTSQSNLGSSALSGLGDMFKMEEQLEALNQIRDTFRESGNNTMSPQELQDAKTKLDQFGLTLKDVGIETAKYLGPMERVGDKYMRQEKVVGILTTGTGKLNNVTNDTSKSLKKASKNLDDMADAAESSRKVTQSVMASAGIAAKMFVDESRIAMRHGVADARDDFGDTATMILKLGISTSKYMELMAENRPVQLAMQSAGKSWKDELVSMSNELQMSGLVGSAEEGAVAAAAFMKNTAMMGVQQSKLGDAAKHQVKLYQQNFRALGVSTGQFNALTEDLINDVDIRKDLAKLSGAERRAYIESLQKRTAENVMMGYSIEKAKELNKHFARMSDEDPLERLSKAAKMRTGLGTLGMGKEGAEMQRLMVQMPTMNGDDKIKAQERMTQIKAQAQEKMQEMMSKNVQSNVAFGQLFADLGLKDTLNNFQTTVREGMLILKKGETVDDARRRLTKEQLAKGEVDVKTMLGVRAVDSFDAAAASSATFIATVGMMWLAGTGLQKGIGAMQGLLTKIAVTGGAGGGPMGKMAGAKAVGAVAVIGYGFSQIYDLIESGGKESGAYELVKDWFPTYEKELGKMLGGMFSDDGDELAALQAKNRDDEEKRHKELLDLQIQLLELNRTTANNTGDTANKVAAGTEQSAVASDKLNGGLAKQARVVGLKNTETKPGSM